MYAIYLIISIPILPTCAHYPPKFMSSFFIMTHWVQLLLPLPSSFISFPPLFPLHSLLEAHFLHSRPFVLFCNLLSLASDIPMMMNLDISVEMWWTHQVHNQRQCVFLPQNPSIATSSAGWNRECEPLSNLYHRQAESWGGPLKAADAVVRQLQVAKLSLINPPRIIKSCTLMFDQHICWKMSWTRTIAVDLSSEP